MHVSPDAEMVLRQVLHDAAVAHILHHRARRRLMPRRAVLRRRCKAIVRHGLPCRPIEVNVLEARRHLGQQLRERGPGASLFSVAAQRPY